MGQVESENRFTGLKGGVAEFLFQLPVAQDGPVFQENHLFRAIGGQVAVQQFKEWAPFDWEGSDPDGSAPCAVFPPWGERSLGRNPVSMS